MSELNREKFGSFVALLRKEKGLTQKALAQQLHVTDKAVSKWERGLSLPDVTLLTPLAETLGITVSELLAGERLVSRSMDARETESLVRQVIDLSGQVQRRRPLFRQKAALPFLLSLPLSFCELFLLTRLGCAWETVWADVGVYTLLPLMFGIYFCLFSPQRLPDYYDQYRINAFYDGPFRIHLPGLRFTNRNLPYIMNIGQLWSIGTLLLSPLLYLLLLRVFPVYQNSPGQYIQLALTLTSLFAPMWLVGRRYE